MIERAILVYGILALLVLGMAEASTLEELLDELETFWYQHNSGQRDLISIYDRILWVLRWPLQ